ncbi:hypothetical protein D910_05519 [Dendroctonus ponderosae]|uniref:Uncharacterized protein n=1 Tax=Dendroctonus ponderosae TaxID=77166 RepID=U4UBZ9_DENPD|nr:hypothetical protein D910_05519 [Dendroctonus ponderosae]
MFGHSSYMVKSLPKVRFKNQRMHKRHVSSSVSLFGGRNGKQGHWNLDMDIPLLDIKSKYNLKGQILVLPLVGHGNCQLKLSEIRTKISTNITFPERNQREIMQVDAMKVKFRIGGLWAQFDHLFNGNEILGDPPIKMQAICACETSENIWTDGVEWDVHGTCFWDCSGHVRDDPVKVIWTSLGL